MKVSYIRGSTGFTPAVKKTRRCRDAAVGENKLKQAMREVGEANDAEEGREGNPVECQGESGGVRRKGRRSKGEKSMEEVGLTYIPSFLGWSMVLHLTTNLAVTSI